MTKQIISYDFDLEVYDTISAVPLETQKYFDVSPPFQGMDDIGHARLPDFFPDTNLVPETNFSNLTPASHQFDLDEFPFATAVKLFHVYTNGKRDLCSGTMVGKKYVLTSAHCIVKPYTHDINISNVEVELNYDFSIDESETINSRVKKIYFIDRWSVAVGEDMALLELEDDLGLISGWMSIGYMDEDEFFQENVFHKMSYPTYKTPFNDYPYNGDTLFYGFGPLDFVSDHFIGVEKHMNGAGGESGSSVFYKDDSENYIAYGVLTWLGNYSHSRIKKQHYYPFEKIINKLEGVVTSASEISPDIDINIYPNPVADLLYLEQYEHSIDPINYILINSEGRALLRDKMSASGSSVLNLSSFPAGQYFLSLYSKGKIVLSKPILKY